MKIRWQKVAPGVYQTDSGRFRARKIGPGQWRLYDDVIRVFGAFRADSLRECKMIAEDQMDMSDGD